MKFGVRVDAGVSPSVSLFDLFSLQGRPPYTPTLAGFLWLPIHSCGKGLHSPALPPPPPPPAAAWALDSLGKWGRTGAAHSGRASPLTLEAEPNVGEGRPLVLAFGNGAVSSIGDAVEAEALGMKGPRVQDGRGCTLVLPS